MRIFCIALLTAAGLFAQLAPPNDLGVSLGHIHFIVTDPDATKKAWMDVFGATETKTGTLALLKIPGMFIVVGKAAMPPATDATSVHHLGIAVQDYASVKAKAAAAGLMWRELTPNVQAFVTFPEAVTV